MEKISVAIITKDEEVNIRQCLESVKWADEIVVVDNGSTDNTLKICREYPVQIYREEWKGYASQKNSAIAKTRNEWVLSLDADERITSGLRKEMEQRLEKNEKISGYFISRKNYFLGRWIRHCGWYPDFNLRLFKKSLGRFQDREVHEKVEVRGITGYLAHAMEHNTYRSLDDYFRRMNKYSTLAAKEMAREGKKFRWRDAFFRPPLTFFQMYFLRAGFMEGYSGLLLSILYSFYTFAKYSKLKELEEIVSLRDSGHSIAK